MELLWHLKNRCMADLFYIVDLEVKRLPEKVLNQKGSENYRKKISKNR